MWVAAAVSLVWVEAPHWGEELEAKVCSWKEQVWANRCSWSDFQQLLYLSSWMYFHRCQQGTEEHHAEEEETS